MTARGATRRAAVVFAQLLQRALEASLPLLLARWFGACEDTDLYTSTWAIFTFAGALLVPHYQDSALMLVYEETKLHAPAAAPRILGSILSHTAMIGAISSLAIGAVAAAYDGSRFGASRAHLTAIVVGSFVLVLPLASVRSLFVAVLCTERRFVAPPATAAAGASIALAFLAATRARLGLAAVPVGALVGELVATVAIAIVATRAYGVRVVACLDRPPAVRRCARLMAYEVGGAALGRVNPLVDQLLVGLAGIAGGGTFLRYSGDVATAPTPILQATLLPVLTAEMAKLGARGEWERLRALVARAVIAVVVLLGVAAIVLCACRGPLLRLAFGGGEIAQDGLAWMSQLVVCHAVGLVPFGAILVLSRAHVACGNGRVLPLVGTISALSNLVLDLVLVRALGLRGLALSTSLVNVVVAIAFAVMLARHLRARSEAKRPERATTPAAPPDRAVFALRSAPSPPCRSRTPSPSRARCAPRS